MRKLILDLICKVYTDGYAVRLDQAPRWVSWVFDSLIGDLIYDGDIPDPSDDDIEN
jgi:hypothetical protein